MEISRLRRPGTGLSNRKSFVKEVHRKNVGNCQNASLSKLNLVRFPYKKDYSDVNTSIEQKRIITPTSSSLFSSSKRCKLGNPKPKSTLLKAMHVIREKSVDAESLRKLFLHWDRNRDGVIDAAELKQVATFAGWDVDEPTTQKLCDRFSANSGSGVKKLKYHDFVHFVFEDNLQTYTPHHDLQISLLKKTVKNIQASNHFEPNERLLLKARMNYSKSPENFDHSMSSKQKGTDTELAGVKTDETIDVDSFSSHASNWFDLPMDARHTGKRQIPSGTYLSSPDLIAPKPGTPFTQGSYSEEASRFETQSSAYGFVSCWDQAKKIKRQMRQQSILQRIRDSNRHYEFQVKNALVSSPSNQNGRVIAKLQQRIRYLEALRPRMERDERRRQIAGW